MDAKEFFDVVADMNGTITVPVPVWYELQKRVKDQFPFKADSEWPQRLSLYGVPIFWGRPDDGQ